MKNRTLSILFITGSLYFIIAEFIAAVHTNVSLIEVYTMHTISSLGVPYNITAFSPLYPLMNSVFILMALVLLIGSLIGLKTKLLKNRLLFSLATKISALGLIIIAFYHAGNPIHVLGALMAILGGNISFIIAGLSIDSNKWYKVSSIILGINGIIFLLLMIYFMTIPELQAFIAVPERISVYSMLAWSVLTGISLLKNKL